MATFIAILLMLKFLIWFDILENKLMLPVISSKNKKKFTLKNRLLVEYQLTQ